MGALDATSQLLGPMDTMQKWLEQATTHLAKTEAHKEMKPPPELKKR